MRHISRPESFAASETNLPTLWKWQKYWRKPVAFRWRRFHGRRRKTSSVCSPKYPRRKPHDGYAHHSRLWIVGRRAAAGLGLGRLRPGQSEEPTPPLLAVGRANRRGRDDTDRHR